MAQSWRITTQFQNLSQTVNPTAGNVGASVIRSYKGGLTPIYLTKGNEQKILSIFGTPSASYPDIWDVIEYNKTADIWISAPSKASSYGGVLVTKTGSKNFYANYTSKTVVDFTALALKQQVAVADGGTLAFIFTVDDYAHYNKQTIDIQVNGVSITVAATDVATEVLTTTPNVGSGTFVRATGVLTFTFLVAPVVGTIITTTYLVNRVLDAYFIIWNKNPQVDDLAIKTTYNTTLSAFNIAAYSKDSSANYTELPTSSYNASLTAGAKDGFGGNIYIVDVFANDDYFTVTVNTALPYSTFTPVDTVPLDLKGGSRGTAIGTSEYTAGWAFFQSPNTYGADIFFDCTTDATVAPLFSTLRNTYQKYSVYLLPLPNTNFATALTNRSSLSMSNRGVDIYWNFGKVANPYVSNSYFYSALMGRVASKHAQMVDVYNGLAPSWIDENSHGGQLGSGIVSMVNDVSETDSQNADTNQINPIIFDVNYGVMITSQKTSINTLSDYSYIAHSRLFDYVISNVVNLVLPAQITKLNDINHRALVKSQAELIVNPLLQQPIPLLAEALVVCDASNNTPQALAKREFHLSVFVKVTPFSEFIKFLFTNIGQTTTVKVVAGQQ